MRGLADYFETIYSELDHHVLLKVIIYLCIAIPPPNCCIELDGLSINVVNDLLLCSVVKYKENSMPNFIKIKLITEPHQWSPKTGWNSLQGIVVSLLNKKIGELFQPNKLGYQTHNAFNWNN